MSEYQYYEFRAIDRSLTPEEQRELRQVSSRASIGATHFVNFYEWGDFKGDVDEWMDTYFDAFLYYANWGTRTLKLRLPSRLLDGEALPEYVSGEGLAVSRNGSVTVLTFTGGHDTEESIWFEDESALLPSMLDLRAELARGDLRVLYLGWLLGVQGYFVDDEDVEPPIPAGLRQPTEAQKAFVEFFDLDEDLLAVAAEVSPALPTERDGERLEKVRAWVAALSNADHEDLLVRLIGGQEPELAQVLFQRAIRPLGTAPTADGGRTAGELRRRSEETYEARLDRERERAAAERARLEREAALAREAYLDGLVGRQGDLWRKIEALAETRHPRNYDEAVGLILDLRDVALRREDATFADRLVAFREAHLKKAALIKRLDKIEP
jgi:hypothetical protein